MHITHHAEGRFRERTGLPKRITDKVAERALTEGLPRVETTGPLRRYMDKLYFDYDRKGDNMRIYQGKVFVFAGEILITILPLKPYMRGIAEKLMKREDAQHGHV